MTTEEKSSSYVNYLIKELSLDYYNLALAIMNHGLLKFEHEDSRRTIFSYNDTENDFEVSLIEAKNDCLLGDHYHQKKDEYFLCLSGSGTYKDADNPSEELEIKEGSRFMSRKNIVHSLQLISGSKILAYNTKAFDANNPDFHKK